MNGHILRAETPVHYIGLSICYTRWEPRAVVLCDMSAPFKSFCSFLLPLPLPMHIRFADRDLGSWGCEGGSVIHFILYLQ